MRNAHEANDRAVKQAYGFDLKMTEVQQATAGGAVSSEAEIVATFARTCYECAFKMYERLAKR